ncbi:hypothetical protein ADEAN_000529700 [Angomonas deanei]|uniref:Uncharacterized protein n=1 Tax=Angomonas deanei TaxID=59799 RepID=A0A7G2CG24_9TRYP|nr:hypothetical protein ADEAN_000529700 [Angomonas deanei]
MEALQISNGRTDASSDYEKFKAAYEANKVQSESEDSNYKKELEKNLEKWTSKLRERIEEQTRIIEENETMFPLMVNNAKEEGARQANQ